MDKKLYDKAIEHTTIKIKNSISIDYFIIQLVSHIEDLDSISNKLIKRLRDWYELYLPEISRIFIEHERFINIIKKSKEELIKQYSIKRSMGQDFSKKELISLQNLRNEVESIYKLKNEQIKELSFLMEKHYPNMNILSGPLIGAKLIKLAGSMKKLIEFPASTIQLLGAEKALFRHIKTGKKPPKYGILLSHPFVAESKEKNKTARKLADKISIAAKVDYFKGEFVGDKLLAMLK